MLLNIQSRTASIAYFVLIASNLFYSPTLTWSSNFLKFGYSKPYIVFGAFFVSSILACITEFVLAPSRRPKARSISSPFNVVSLAILRALTVTGIILGLVHTSPFRVITLTLGSQLWIHKVQHPKSLFSKTVILFLLGWLLSFYSDMNSLKEIESTPNSTTFKNLLFSYTWLMISCISQYSRKFFEIKLVASSVAPLGFKAKELNIHFQMIFSLTAAAVITVPWLWIEQSLHSGEPIQNPHSLFYQLMCFSSFASTVILSDYYIELLAQTELHTFKHIPYVWTTSVVGSILHIWANSDSEKTLKLSGLPQDLTFLEFVALASIILGFIVAYTQSSTTSTKQKSLDLMPISSESSWADTITYFVRAILASQDSKQIFYFLLLNLSYMFVQLAYGFWTNSLGLISDAIHMFFDCVALGVGLFASVTSKWKKNRDFSYGYSRVEVLSGFSNGIFLALISIFIVLEAIARLLHPPEMNTDRLLLVSFMGLVVNLIGILAFNHGHHHGHSHGHDHGHSHSHSHGEEHTSIQMNGVSHNHDHDHHHDHDHDHDHDHHDHSHGHDHDHAHSNGHAHSHDHGHSHGGGGGGCGGHSHNMEGVFLHILADTLGSVGVIISTLLIQWFGWTGFDPIASMFIAGLIFFSVLPLIRSSFNILLLYVPPHINQGLNYSLKEISSQLGNNCEILEAKVWPNDHDSYVLTLSLKFYENFNSSDVQRKVEKIVNINLPNVKDITIQTFN